VAANLSAGRPDVTVYLAIAENRAIAHDVDIPLSQHTSAERARPWIRLSARGAGRCTGDPLYADAACGPGGPSSVPPDSYPPACSTNSVPPGTADDAIALMRRPYDACAPLAVTAHPNAGGVRALDSRPEAPSCLLPRYRTPSVGVPNRQSRCGDISRIQGNC
jgi:hypothetical protein